MYTRRDFLKRTCAFAAVSAVPGLAPSCNARTPARPNIIFFFVDDMGWQDTSEPFYKEITKLNRTYHSPNVEKLSAEGMKFTQAYACAVCSPTRVSLMTGLNAARHRVTNWTLRKNASPDPNHKTLRMPKWNVNGLSPVPGIERTVHVRTLPMFLREAGYRTIHVGKATGGQRALPAKTRFNWDLMLTSPVTQPAGREVTTASIISVRHGEKETEFGTYPVSSNTMERISI